jgi:transcriptional regulator with XRE-family HTH domain
MTAALRDFRRDVLGLSQERLAAKLGTSKASISRMENGVQPVTLDLVKRVAALTNSRAAREALVSGLFQSEAAQ